MRSTVMPTYVWFWLVIVFSATPNILSLLLSWKIWAGVLISFDIYKHPSRVKSNITCTQNNNKTLKVIWRQWYVYFKSNGFCCPWMTHHGDQNIKLACCGIFWGKFVLTEKVKLFFCLFRSEPMMQTPAPMERLTIASIRHRTLSRGFCALTALQASSMSRAWWTVKRRAFSSSLWSPKIVDPTPRARKSWWPSTSGIRMTMHQPSRSVESAW